MGGGAPAGAAAAIYAARKRVKTLFITSEWGGQSTVSTDIQNWIGTPSISGNDLAKALRTHVEAYAGEWLTIKSPAYATSLTPHEDRVEVTTKDGTTYEGQALLITTGANRRKLNVPGAAEYDQKGLTYCASCDGPLFADKDVAVIGGGNAGFETALQLLAYCKSVTLLHKNDSYRADKITVDAALANPKMRGVLNAEPVAILGDTFVTGVKWRDAKTGKEETASVEGVFVEIGLIPNTGWIGSGVELNEVKQVKVDPRTQRASHPRVWAAGDVTDGLYHQNNIAAGDAVRALEDIYMNLRKA
jgi:alkyl hydroperoxide reductase subunit F